MKSILDGLPDVSYEITGDPEARMLLEEAAVRVFMEALSNPKELMRIAYSGNLGPRLASFFMRLANSQKTRENVLKSLKGGKLSGEVYEALRDSPRHTEENPASVIPLFR